MNKLFVCVFLGVIAVALGATPNRPAIPNQWFSEIQVSVSSSQGSGNGGGLLAVDIPKNMAKQDYRFVDEKHQIQDVHILERFDLGEVYEVFQWTKCVTVPVKGNVEDPFAWVAKAVYNGTSTYRGRSHDEWIYQATNFEAKLFVDSDNVNAPVFWETNNKTSGVQVSFIFLFFDAREPDSWVFEVPSACHKNLTYNKHGVQEGGCGDITNFAHANWNCGDVACSYRVPDGSAQPGYACAEFTARCLAAGGAIPGLGPYDSQGAYSNVNGYNLLYVEDLHNWCSSHGYRPIYPQAGNVGASYAICGDGGGGAFSHACIGVGPAQDACHNIARDWHSSYGTFAAGIQGIWAPPGC